MSYIYIRTHFYIMDSKVLERFVNQLDVMYQPGADQRPKTQKKLVNVSQKANRLLYVTLDTFDELLHLTGGIPIKEVDDIKEKIYDIDIGVAAYVYNQAAQKGRTVHIIPCDDTEELATITSKLKVWYDGRLNQTFNADNKYSAIAEACSQDTDLCPQELIESLIKFGYVRNNGPAQLVYLLPEASTVDQIAKIFETWENDIKKRLGDISKHNYQKFAEKIILMNNVIQHQAANRLNPYCEAKFASNYPGSPTTRSGSDYFRLKALSSLHIGDEQMEVSQDSKPIESDTNMPDLSVKMLQLELRPQHVSALIYLSRLANKPATLDKLAEALTSVCRVTYVTSPSGFLSEVGRKRSVHLGSIATEYTFYSNDIEKLTNILRTPVQKKCFQQSFSYLRQTPDLRGPVREFMEHLFKVATTASQQHGQTIIINDPAARKRAKEVFKTYLVNASESQMSPITEKELFDTIIQFSMESARLPSDTIIQGLIDSKYLDINAETQVVTYKSYFTWQRQPATSPTSQKENVYQEWSKLYVQKYQQEQMDVQQVAANRKRPCTMNSEPCKKTKMDI